MDANEAKRLRTTLAALGYNVPEPADPLSWLEAVATDLADNGLPPPPRWEYIDPEATLEYVTADIEINRTMSEGVVETYARQMANGDWKLSTDALCISTEHGKAVNGQHRLRAVFDSGKGQYFLVARWPVQRALDLMVDTGRTRSIGTLMQLTPDHAALVGVLARFAMDDHWKQKLTAVELEPFRHPFEAERAKLEAVCGARKKWVTRAAIRAAFIVRMIGEPDRMDEFTDQYRRFVHCQDGRVPGLAHLYSHMMHGRGQTDYDNDLAVRAYLAIDFKKDSRFHFGDKVRNDTYAEMVRIVKARCILHADRDRRPRETLFPVKGD